MKILCYSAALLILFSDMVYANIPYCPGTEKSTLFENHGTLDGSMSDSLQEAVQAYAKENAKDITQHCIQQSDGKSDEYSMTWGDSSSSDKTLFLCQSHPVIQGAAKGYSCGPK